MKNAKRIVSLILASLLLVAGLSACGDGNGSDKEYVQKKGKLVIGITNFAPMDYKEGDGGEWIGFDADMAKAFAASLGVEAEFIEINWSNKVLELNGKNIDCVWNGMTLNDEVKNAMSTSNAYCKNMQVVVVKSDKKDVYNSIEAIKELNFVAESGSAGEIALKALGYKVTPLEKQSDALTEVKAGTADAAVIDLLMAGAMTGEGTSYSDLSYTVALNEQENEQYGVGFRKGSDLTAALNEFMRSYYASGDMQKLAEKYGISDTVIAQN